MQPTYNHTTAAIKTADPATLDNLISLCIGRVLRLGSRPEQPGDGAEFEKYSRLAKDAAEELKSRF